MKIYKISFNSTVDSSQGFKYCSNKKDVAKAVKEYINNEPERYSAEVEVIDVKPTKKGIISALNEHGGHNDNG